MANKKFSEAEMKHLRLNQYVLEISPDTVYFSAEFKKKFWEAILKGKKLRDAIFDLGIDPDILGINRITGLKWTIKNNLETGKGFRDLHTYKKSLDRYRTPEHEIKYLEQQLAYKDQEIEFLKKIVSLGKEDSE